MKNALIAATLLFSTPVLAGFDSGNTMWADCSSKQSFRETACMMAASAYYDMMLILGFECQQNGVVRQQVADVYTKYLREHPEERHLAAPLLAIFAYQGAFNCKMTPTKPKTN